MAEILAARSASFMQVLGAFKQGNKNTSSEGGAAGAFLGVLRAQLSASVAEGSAVEGAEGSIFGLTSAQGALATFDRGKDALLKNMSPNLILADSVNNTAANLAEDRRNLPPLSTLQIEAKVIEGKPALATTRLDAARVDTVKLDITITAPVQSLAAQAHALEASSRRTTETAFEGGAAVASATPSVLQQDNKFKSLIEPLDKTLTDKTTNEVKSEVKSGLTRDIAGDIAHDIASNFSGDLASNFAGEVSGEKSSVAWAGGAGLTSGEASGEIRGVAKSGVKEEAANALVETAAPHRSSPSLASASGVEAEFETQFEAQFGAKLADKLDAQQAVGLATSQSPYQSAPLSAFEIAPAPALASASASALEVTSDTSALSKQPWVKVDQLPPRQGETTSNVAIDTSLKHSLFIHELVDKKATDSVGNVAANFTETRQNLPPLTIEKELETKLSEPLATGLNKKVNKLLENEAAEERLTPPLTAQINTPPIGVQFGDRFEGRLENQLGTQRAETESTLAASKPDVVLATRSSSWSAQAGELETSSTRSTATVVEAAFALQQDNKFSAIVDQPTKTLASKAVSEIKNESINEMFGKKSGAEIGAEVVSEIVSEIVSKVDPEADAVMRTAATITAASSPVATAAELRQDSQSFTPAVLKMVPAAALAAKEITGSEGNAAANLSEARQDRLSFANAVGAERSLPPLTTQINTPPTEGQLSAQRTRTATQADAVLLKDVPSLSGQESELEANSTLITGSTFEAASKAANASASVSANGSANGSAPAPASVLRQDNEFKAIIDQLDKTLASKATGEMPAEKSTVALAAATSQAINESTNSELKKTELQQNLPSFASAGGADAKMDTKLDAKLEIKTEAQQAVGLGSGSGLVAPLSTTSTALRMAPASALEATSDPSALSKEAWVNMEQLTLRQGETKTYAAIEAPLKHPLFANELAGKVVWLAGRQAQFAELTLNPQQMGALEVRLTVSGGEATAQFFSSNPLVREVIDAALPKLRELMAQAGLTLGEAEVRDQAFSRQEHAGSQHGNGTKSQNGREGVASALASMGMQRPSALGLVDLFI